jgi:type I restriction enzyme, R subunit
MAELEVVIRGVFDKRRFLDLLRYFIVFEEADEGKLVKKIAGNHQFHAVNVALEETLRAAVPPLDAVPGFDEEAGRYHARPMAGGAAGDRRVGVVRSRGNGISPSNSRSYILVFIVITGRIETTSPRPSPATRAQLCSHGRHRP